MQPPRPWSRRSSRSRTCLVTGGAVLLLATITSIYAAYIYAPYLKYRLGVGEPLRSHLNGGGDDGGNTHGRGDDASWLHPEEHVFREPRTIRLVWNVTLEQQAPDGVMKSVFAINGRRLSMSMYMPCVVRAHRTVGQFPGPIIEARSGDELVVHVYNGIDPAEAESGISIHWHGLHMKGEIQTPPARRNRGKNHRADPCTEQERTRWMAWSA